MDWIGALLQLRREGVPGVLVTVTAVRGHAPRDAGAKMVVAADHAWGTIGGGNLEECAVERAREIIAQGVTRAEQMRSRLNAHERAKHGQQCCGGEVELLLEPLPARPTVAIFGVGHVGFELARILSRLEIQLHLVDSRVEQMEELRLAAVTDGSADVTAHRVLLGEAVLEQVPAGSHVLIMTHDHAEDFALCDAVLRRGDLGTVGLIGSTAKWARFSTLLRAAGHSSSAIEKIACPIGDPSILGKEPAVIAISVAAELLRAFEATAAPAQSLADHEMS